MTRNNKNVVVVHLERQSFGTAECSNWQNSYRYQVERAAHQRVSYMSQPALDARLANRWASREGSAGLLLRAAVLSKQYQWWKSQEDTKSKAVMNRKCVTSYTGTGGRWRSSLPFLSGTSKAESRRVLAFRSRREDGDLRSRPPVKWAWSRAGRIYVKQPIVAWASWRADPAGPARLSWPSPGHVLPGCDGANTACPAFAEKKKIVEVQLLKGNRCTDTLVKKELIKFFSNKWK